MSTHISGNAPNNDVAASLAAMQRGDLHTALQLLSQAEKQQPANAEIKLHTALALRLQGNLQAALQYFDAALALDPYSFLALLSKGELLRQMGQTRQAAQVLRNALKIAPPEGRRPRSLEEPLQRARELVDAEAQEQAEFLRNRVSEVRSQFPAESLARFDESLEVLAGTKRIYNAEPVQLHISRLPAIPFFDRKHFPWLAELEAATVFIQQELQALLDDDLPGFAPYIDYPPGTPENQFRELNRSRLWSSLWLWRDGTEQTEATARCPKTVEILRSLPLCDQPGFAPTAIFSALAPHTRIPPHTGSTNARLLVHLPLVLPGPAGFRVGNEQREWRIGEAWVFDDTIEHEAWNEADETRVILIFDVWNPLLSEAERELISHLLLAHREWYG